MPMGKRELWHKAGRFVTGVVVLCFFLPFFGVSCGGPDVISISGTDMIGGCKPGGLATGANVTGGEITVDKVEVEPLAIIALVLVVGAAGFAWVRSRKALIASMVLCIASIGALVGLYVKVAGELDRGVAEQIRKQEADRASAHSLEGRIAESMAEVDAGGRIGLWAAFLLLIASTTLAGMALKDPTPEVATTPRAGPPPG
jgi:hypothetical protein